MNVDDDVRGFLEEMAGEPSMLLVDPEPVVRRAHRRLARTAVLGSVAATLAVTVAIGGVGILRNGLSTEPIVGDQPKPTAMPIRCSDGNGECLGPLPAGTYASRLFAPAITYTVPEGWSNSQDLSGNFVLVRPASDAPITIWITQRVRAPLPCKEAPDPAVGGSVSEIASWMALHPGLITTSPQPVTVGGLDGVVMDVSIDPTWTGTCPWFGDDPVVSTLMGEDPSGFHHSTYRGLEERFFLLEYQDRTLAIEVGPDGNVPHAFPTLDSFIDQVTPIVERLRFGT